MLKISSVSLQSMETRNNFALRLSYLSRESICQLRFQAQVGPTALHKLDSFFLLNTFRRSRTFVGCSTRYSQLTAGLQHPSIHILDYLDLFVFEIINEITAYNISEISWTRAIVILHYICMEFRVNKIMWLIVFDGLCKNCVQDVRKRV